MEEKEINKPNQPIDKMRIKSIFQVFLLLIGTINFTLCFLQGIFNIISGLFNIKLVAKSMDSNMITFIISFGIFFILEELERINNNTNKTNQP